MREITVYNTMTRQKEVFNPVTPGEAKMYVCGVTPQTYIFASPGVTGVNTSFWRVIVL